MGTLVLSLLALTASQKVPCDDTKDILEENPTKMAGNRERTFIMLKPDAVQRGLVKYMNSGPVVPMVWEGLNVVKTGRVMLGETNPAASLPGTIRGDYCIQVGRNICHGSDAPESAAKEIALWFKDEELVKWDPVGMSWVYEDFEPTA